MAPGPVSVLQRPRVFARKNQSFPMGTTNGSYSAYVPEYTDFAVIFSSTPTRHGAAL
jgi:hypothetical protein